MPKISCIMTTYNSEKFLREAIESILNQSFNDFEFIISDWWSRDLTKEIIKQYQKKDNRIIFLDNNKRKSIHECLNDCLKVSKWQYIAIMESDDISDVDRFAVEIDEFYRNPSLDVVIPSYKSINEGWEDVGEPVIYINDLFSKYTKSDFLFDSKIWVVDCMFKKNIIEKIGYFSCYTWDYNFQCNIFFNDLKRIFIQNILYIKRENSNQLTCVYSKSFLEWIRDNRIKLIKQFKLGKKDIYLSYLKYYQNIFLKNGINITKKIGIYNIFQPLWKFLFKFIKL